MADGGGLTGLVLQLSLLLLLLGLASLELQAWTSRKAVPSQKVVKSTRSVKHKIIVQGEAAGHGIPDRVQCEAKPTKTKKATGIQKIEMKNLHDVLRAFLESIQVSMPDSTRVTVITNQIKLKGALPQNVDWRPTTRRYNRRNLMIQRLESYIAFLEDAVNKRKNRSTKPITHIIFSDYDMIVVDDLRCLFRDYPSFDVALTYRNNRKQPINSGIIMVRGTLESLSRAKSLLKETVQVYRVKFRHAFGILGDQLALADIVKATVQARQSEGVPFEALVKATRILFLPCAFYNWTPSEGAGQFHGMPIEVKILHFKGSRKQLMVHAWSLYKQERVKDFTNMKCLLLKSGRSKYDY